MNFNHTDSSQKPRFKNFLILTIIWISKQQYKGNLTQALPKKGQIKIYSVTKTC